MPTVGEKIAELTSVFGAAGLPTPRLDARVLIASALGTEPSLLFARSDVHLDETTATAISGFAARRTAREPVARIVGRREFYGLAFKVTPDTLDPRPDTETVVEVALAHCSVFTRPRILDLGTGTGCILLAILSACPQASGLGVDISPKAVAVARENTTLLGLGERAVFQVGDWGESLAETFDLVVCNPPYIATDQMAVLDPDVRLYDPALALAGGNDGLGAYRRLLPWIPKLLTASGRLMLEVGAGQAEDVGRLPARQDCESWPKRRIWPDSRGA